MNFCEIVTKRIDKPLQKIQEICETVLLQNFFLKVNRKGMYYIWMRLKSRKVELKQRVKVSLEKYVGMFRHDCRYNIKFIFTDTKPDISKVLILVFPSKVFLT